MIGPKGKRRKRRSIERGSSAPNRSPWVAFLPWSPNPTAPNWHPGDRARINDQHSIPANIGKVVTLIAPVPNWGAENPWVWEVAGDDLLEQCGEMIMRSSKCQISAHHLDLLSDQDSTDE